VPQDTEFVLISRFIDRLELGEMLRDTLVQGRSLGLSWVVDSFDHQPGAEDRKPKTYQMELFKKDKSPIPSQTNESI
jgi:hypothetical protein